MLTSVRKCGKRDRQLSFIVAAIRQGTSVTSMCPTEAQADAERRRVRLALRSLGLTKEQAAKFDTDWPRPLLGGRRNIYSTGKDTR